MDLDTIEVLAAYCEDQQLYTNCLYRPQPKNFKPRAAKSGPVIWIVKDGKPVNLMKGERQ